MTEKKGKRQTHQNRRSAFVAIVCCQQLLLWSSLYVVASTSYLFALKAISADILPSAILLLVAVSVYEELRLT